MTTYSRWKNARPYDCKINDVEMLRFMLLVATIPAWLVYAWALAFAEIPSYLRSRWLNITG